ncbi:hypothetical protein EPUS_04678 [Endocarpon pusillum Z07020]|uniref:Uncharacterized protein n=1 Tax=Endocarpon pusillum (strain Z07020 / HMAS-L-300199) TaxID=1263415 RepID=U1HET9_ENDPU|nr:uncharacterized protein EPUS_04678 [Endocarpon pusillum Z07020]ERF68580.1 hypothetical protein EPUS_04678 [Endocarpon pusillum Z07020]
MTDSNMTETRPRPKSVLSFESKRSRRSSGSSPKLELTESHKDKKRLYTKADPSMAMNEAQPAAVALEESNLDNIRKITWKDAQGNVIADPDLSNPTRSRMERPLDTIRSFEAAVEGTYNSRRSIPSRPVSQATYNVASRRSSYFGGNGGNKNGRSQQPGGYYQNGRSYGPRPESVAEDYYEGQDPRHSYPPRPMRHGSSHMMSASSPENIYPSHGHQPSYDTFTTGEGSYGTDTRGNSTDPSSQNSSVDRFPTKPEEYPSDNNQAIGYSNGPYSPVSPVYSSEHSFWKGANGRPQAPYGGTEYMNGGGSNHQTQKPAVLRKEALSPPSAPIKLDTGSDAGSRPTPPKRQSWLKRRFSRKGRSP